MDKQQLRKNRLDLEYGTESQKLNAILILLTTGLLGFVGTFVWLQKKYFLSGFSITLVVLLIASTHYVKIKGKMKQIPIDIETIQ